MTRQTGNVVSPDADTSSDRKENTRRWVQTGGRVYFGTGKVVEVEQEQCPGENHLILRVSFTFF